jgi:hypothetical protein
LYKGFNKDKWKLTQTTNKYYNTSVRTNALLQRRRGPVCPALVPINVSRDNTTVINLSRVEKRDAWGNKRGILSSFDSECPEGF